MVDNRVVHQEGLQPKRITGCYRTTDGFGETPFGKPIHPKVQGANQGVPGPNRNNEHNVRHDDDNSKSDDSAIIIIAIPCVEAQSPRCMCTLTLRDRDGRYHKLLSDARRSRPDTGLGFCAT